MMRKRFRPLPYILFILQKPHRQSRWGKLIWHNISRNLLCLCRYLQVPLHSENGRCSITHSSHGTPPIICFCLGITIVFLPPPPYTPSECHCNMGVWERQGECYKFVTYLMHYNVISAHPIYSSFSST